ncbi:hypothetical protein AB0I81_63230 [Nonomuraea sp. NPDC050404]|uniref:hypothetical protein n=1 Tax=Nonomuraea sp. NPDC050404 TaxID=3155783 RepID=UPI003403551B
MNLPAGKKVKGLVWAKPRVEAFNQAFTELLRTVRPRCDATALPVSLVAHPPGRARP